MTIHWKAVEQYLTVELFAFQFTSVCNFGKFINFGLDTLRSERVKKSAPLKSLLPFSSSDSDSDRDIEVQDKDAQTSRTNSVSHGAFRQVIKCKIQTRNQYDSHRSYEAIF